MSYGEIFCFYAFLHFTLLLLCFFSQPLKFYLKVILYHVALLSVWTISTTFFLLEFKNPNNLQCASWIVRYIISPAFGLKWDVKNEENLYPNDLCVFVCNHQSILDVAGMLYIWPLLYPCTTALQDEFLYSGPFGIFNSCRKFDASYPFNVSSIWFKAVSENLWFFPEGTRNDKKTLLPFKVKPFENALMSKIPIVPIVFYQNADLYSISKKIFERGTITITVLACIETREMFLSDAPVLTEKVHMIMMECLANSVRKQSEEEKKKD